MTKNTEVETLMGQCSDETAQKSDVQLAADRKALDEYMRDFTQMLNALTLVMDNPASYELFIEGLTQTQAGYQQRYEEHKRANKRVKITSDIVGNHTYAVSSGWTWTMLSAKIPKALALDPTLSAPGKEPVVLAVRIVSLDSKAKKAGGLCVALKGTPVRPYEEVDASTKYELVSYSE